MDADNTSSLAKSDGSSVFIGQQHNVGVCFADFIVGKAHGGVSIFLVADLVGITVRCDGKDHFHVMAGCIHGLHDCCLIGMIPENHSPDNDEIKTLLWLMSNRRIENKQIMILRGNDEPTRIMVRIDQEILDDLINWFTIMFTVCGLLVDESFFQL